MAELVVRMEGAPGGLAMTCKYEFRSSNVDGTGPLEQEYVVDPSPGLVGKLCAQIDKIVDDALGPAPTGTDPAVELAKTGKLLYDALFPSSDGSIPELVQRLRQAEGPLLVRTNESSIPWELLHDGADFLALAHDIGRRTFVTRRVVAGRAIDVIGRALVVGDPLGDLASARQEAEWIESWLGEHGVDCTLLLGEQATLLRVVDELSSGSYDLLHYCGHVGVPVGTKYVGLRLHDDDLLDRRALEPLAQFGAPPIVFVNGCASADNLANLCVSFMVMGAKVVVGNRYAVQEEPARRFAEGFYTDLISGSTAGAAIRSARGALRESSAIDWAGFVLYGDPAMRIAVGERPPPDPPPVDPPSPTGTYRMDDAAAGVIDRMVRQAAPAGFATSLDLLIELLSTEDMRSRVSGAVGSERLALAADLLRTFRESVPTTAVATDDEVELSDTVSSVLVRAERGAQEAGRDLITLDDLVTAFVAVGGGSSGKILDLFGISLADLAGTGTKVTSTTSAALPVIANGTRPTEVAPEVAAAEEEPFAPTGRLRIERLHPDVAAAVRVAAFLASAQRTVISTSLLLYGFALAGGDVFRNALQDQGNAGVAALDQLSPARRTNQNRFSSRTRRALARSTGRADGQVDPAAVLRE
ncbi:MAG TPA: CHAT domain-containing protein, partial [Micromonosporaceae bacterium]